MRLVAVLTVTVFALFGAVVSDARALRDTLTSTLPSTLFMFGIIAGLITYLLSNHVRGIYTAALASISRARESVWKYRDQYRNHSSAPIQEIYILNLLPLVGRQQLDWFEPNNIRSWDKSLGRRLNQIEDPETRIEVATRYLLPIHEAVEELTLLYVRSVIATIQVRHTFGSFGLVAFVLAVNIAVRVIPYGSRLDLFVVALVAATLTFTLIELLLLFDFASSEVKNEISFFQRASQAWASAEHEEEEESPQEVLDKAFGSSTE